MNSPKNSKPVQKNNNNNIVLFLICLAVVGFIVVYRSSGHKIDLPNDNSFSENLVDFKEKIVTWFEDKSLLECNDTIWCNVTMPTVSYFKFDPPTDPARWRLAQIQASTGEQVLLKHTIRTFPNYLDFLDGDILFRQYHQPIDIFVDKKRDLSPLKLALNKAPPGGRRLADFDWEAKGHHVIPGNYDFVKAGRAPVVKIGYFAFSQEGKSQWHQGPHIGEAALDLKGFLKQWSDVKNEIQTPFIALHSSNENWGLLSTFFPNRSENWGSCCEPDVTKTLLEFLNHDKTLMLMIGQHSNITHPKIVTIPRGLPTFNTHAKRIVWDMMQQLLKHTPKSKLVFTASSSWGPRPQILQCVGKKFPAAEFDGRNFGGQNKGRIDQYEYYRRLGSSRMGLALGGLGTDTFRLWEALTIGTVPVVEKGFGLEKTVRIYETV